MMKKYIFSAMLFAFLFTTTTFHASELQSDGIVVRTEEEFREAIFGWEPIIVIDGDIYFSGGGFSVAHNLTLRGAGTITVPNLHRHFVVGRFGILTLDGDITLAAMPDQWGTGGVRIDGGIFNMHRGTIDGNDTSNSGVEVWRYSIFNMHGGKITGNRGSRNGGGVDVFSSIFNMYGGEISGNGFMDNSLGLQGGGVNLSSSTFNMHGGSVNNNTAGTGGGIQANFSTVNIYGGEIRDNVAQAGGGIETRESRVNIHGGKITGNRATQWSGGGISLGGTSGMNHLIMHGGTIAGNSANRGGGVSISAIGLMVIHGGTISDNTATATGGAISYHCFDSIIIGPNAVFYGNTADRGRNLGIAAGREMLPHIMWSGENSRPGTHLVNNYDIGYEGSWLPSLWQIHLGIAVAVVVFNGILFGPKWLRGRGKMTAVGTMLVFVLVAITSQITAAAEEIVVTDEDRLRQAMEVHETEEIILIVNDIINIENYIEVNRPTTIRGDGTITVSGEHRHFIVRLNIVLTLEGNVTLTRAEGYDGPGGGIFLDAGVMNMNGGNIVNNYWDGYPWGTGGAVDIRIGLFTMYGGLIDGNTAHRGGGVAVRRGDFEMRGGQISNNRATLNGGGVYVTPDSGIGFLASFSMRGGRIVENTAGAAGGGVFGRFVFLDLIRGEIRDNAAAGHGGVFATDSTIITTGPNMRIINNSPVNVHDNNQSTFAWFITPDIYRFAAVFAVAIGGVIYTRRYRL